MRLLLAFAALQLAAHAQTTGGLDPSFRFSPGAAGAPPSQYALVEGGNAVVVGQFTSYHGVTRKGVVRLTTDGSVDTGFDPKGGPGDVVTVIPNVTTIRSPGAATHVAAYTDSRVIVAGAFSTWDSFTTRNLVRLKSDGSVDTSFVSTLPVGGPLLVLPDGKILVAGRARDFGNTRKIGLVRLASDGTLDTTFADAEVGAFAGLDLDLATVNQVVRQEDGKLVILFAGLKGGGPAYGVARLEADGALDPTFKTGLTSGILSILTGVSIDGSGRVAVAGSGSSYGGQTVTKVFRLTSTGTIDPSFAPAIGINSALGIHAFADGSMVVAGTFAGFFGPVVRLLENGTRDATFGFTQTGSFGSLFVAQGAHPKVNAQGQIFVLSSTIMLQTGGQIVQGNGPLRLTGSAGGGTATPPTISSPPVAVTAALGGSATFSVSATGTAPLAYQWKKGGVAISGATAATFTLATVTEADAGDYSVTISNLGGSVTSAVVALTVTRPPRITSVPASPVLAGQGTSVSLTVVADGPGTLSYVWYRNGDAVAGATGATLVLNNVQAADVGAYDVEVKNPYGSVRSSVIQVNLAPIAPAWWVSSATDGPGTITDLWRDGARGVVVSGTYAPAANGTPEFTFGGVTFPRPSSTLNGFVGRIDDAGTPLWMIPVVGDLSHSLRVGTYVAAAADAQGNVFLAGPMRGVGTVSGLNLGIAGGEGSFVAKLDSQGKGLWAKFVSGNLYERQLAVDPDGNVILTGRYTSTLVLENHTLSAVAFGAAAVFKLGADGSVRWAKNYQKGDTVGGAVDIYNVTADASGIYLTGTYDQSIRFGNFTERLLAPPFRAVGWLGKLDADGTPQWLRAIGGSLPKDIALGPVNTLWIVGQDDPPGGQVLHGYRTDGAFISRGVVARSSGGSLLAAGVGVDSAQRPLIGGHSLGFATVGGLTLGFGQNPQLLWGAAGATNGAVGFDAAMTAYLRIPPTGAIVAQEFEASPSADFYYAGTWTGVMNANGSASTNLFQKVFVLKTSGLPLPSTPVVVQSPASRLFALGENSTLSCVAKGGGLAFRWLKNGQPIPENNLRIDTYPGPRIGELASVVTFIGMTEANAGDYVCEVSNVLGTATSSAAHLESGSVPAIVTQPAAQRVNGGQALSLTVSATGGNLVYEWYKNGAPIAGAPNAPTLVIPAATAADAAVYTVQVSNGLGSVQSRPARAIVCTGLPEPTFLGRPWVRVLDDTQVVPGTTTSFGLWNSDERPRFTLKDRVVHLVATAAATDALHPGHRALLRWRTGTLETLVWTNTTTTDGDRFLDCFYPTDETEGAMNFSAFTVDTAGQPRSGLYELRGGALTRRVDDRTALPTGAGRFLVFGSNVRRGATMIGYPGTFGDVSGAGSGIYAVETASLRQVVAGNATLPSAVVTTLGGLPSNFGLAFDGVRLAFAVADVTGPARQAVFASDLAGNVTRLAQVGDPIPGRAGETFASFGGVDVAGGAVFFSGLSTSQSRWLVRAKDGQLSVLGTATTLSASGAEQVYADAATSGVNRYTNGNATPEIVLPAEATLDCRTVKRVWQVDAEGDDVVIGVDFTDGGAGVFACVSEGPVTPPASLRLAPPSLVGSTLRIGVPTRAGKNYRIEANTNPALPGWGTVNAFAGDGANRSVDLEVSGSHRFFRVVEE